MSPHIKIQWIGIRKDSNHGSICGWFTEAGKSDEISRYPGLFGNPPSPKCHMFYGKIRKGLHIVEFDLTHEFKAMIESKRLNFKTADPEKITSRWGEKLNEDLSMYILMLKMVG